MIWHIIERLKRVRGVDTIVLATTTRSEDIPLVAVAKECGVQGFAGSAEDVLDRVYQAASAHQAEVIVHIGGDCPFVDPPIVERALEIFFSEPLDYVTNTLVQTYPSGLDVNVFSWQALARAWKEATLAADRHHLCAYFHRHVEKFQVKNFGHETPLAFWRWTLDYPEDLAFVREVYRHLYREGEVFHQEDILDLLQRRPDIAAINQERALTLAERPAVWDSEGYLFDLQKDLMVSAQKAVEADQKGRFAEAEQLYRELTRIAQELGERTRALARA